MLGRQSADDLSGAPNARPSGSARSSGAATANTIWWRAWVKARTVSANRIIARTSDKRTRRVAMT